MNFMKNVVDYLEAFLQQKAHEADRKRGKATSRIDVELATQMHLLALNQSNVGKKSMKKTSNIDVIPCFQL
jgi:ElaB/YqjD/DUF883 family membrane-anchored ribosome-binding protein